MVDRAARDEEIRRLYVERDLPIMVVAARVGLSYARVRQILHELGAPLKPAGPNYHSPHTWQAKKSSARLVRTDAPIVGCVRVRDPNRRRSDTPSIPDQRPRNGGHEVR
jgi:hypothetical protein